jgi:DNA-binding transcriptional MerR regulator
MERTENPYTSKDISMALDIGDSTLRKWCLSLEEQNYHFYRTDQNKRLFTEHDIVVLRHYQHLIKDKNMSMQNAALIVSSKFQKAPFSDGTEIEQLENEMNSVPALRSGDEFIQELVTEIKTMKEQQNELIEMNRQLFKRLDEQQKYIEERMDKRDSVLLDSIRESQEVKKQLLQIATAQEEKKGFFARLLGK